MTPDGPHPLFAELLDRSLAAALTTLDPDGSPRSVMVWCDREGEQVSINAGAETTWFANVRRDSRLALIVHDPDNALRYVAVRGRVAEITPDPDYQHVDRLSERYEQRRYQYTRPSDVERLKLLVEVVSLRTHDHRPPPSGLR